MMLVCGGFSFPIFMPPKCELGSVLEGSATVEELLRLYAAVIRRLANQANSQTFRWSIASCARAFHQRSLYSSDCLV